MAAGRKAEDITLVGACKRQPDEVLEAALADGLQTFGENRVQEAMERWTHFAEARKAVSLRLIGPLQTNKAEDAVALFDVIETVDRMKLARALRKAMDQSGREVKCLVQVNTGEEDQKSGIAPADLPAFLEEVRAGAGLDIVGLMCIPPQDEPPGPHFALLAKLAIRHGLSELSMGMSGDFETAIRFGATHIRVGSDLFGPRPG